jgi:glycine/D-amino acid oxidase-like deaminating enzyme
MIHDLIIVGGGMSGISVGHFFRNKNILLLESGKLLSGATGHNAGFIISGFGEHYKRTVSRLGRERARQIQHIHLYSHKMIRDLAQNCYYVKTGSLSIPYNEKEFQELEESFQFLKEDQFNVEWIDNVDVGLRTKFSALLNHDDGVIDSQSFWRTLASDLPVHTECGVLEIIDGLSTVKLQTTKGMFEAEKVVFCLNAFSASLLPELAGFYIPLRGQMLKLGLKNKVPTNRPVIMNYGDIYWNFRAETFNFGGLEYCVPDAEVGIAFEFSPAILNAQSEWIKKLMDQELFDSMQPLQSWFSTMAFTVDGFPFVGKLERPGCFISAGMCGLGHSYAMECARWLHELITKDRNIIPDFCDSSRIKSLKRFTGGDWRNEYEAWNHGIH